MSILPILTYPDPLLKKVSEPVEVIDDSIRKLVEDMAETMYEAPGIGLAAPQVGVLKHIITIDLSPQVEDAELVALINPKILSGEGQIAWEEGCLSVPEIFVEIPRYEFVHVEGLDPSGDRIEYHADGIFAIALQHEIDHLDGRLIIDRVSPLKRSLYRKRRLKNESVQASV